jgi:hypothetical protein
MPISITDPPLVVAPGRGALRADPDPVKASVNDVGAPRRSLDP